MSAKKKSFTGRKLLIWAIVLIMVPFGFTMEQPAKVIGEFLPK